MTTRRQFLTTVAGSGTVLALGSAAPSFWLNALAAEAGSNSERILVVVQLSGGNDGLNTVVPIRNDEYYKNRPTLAVERSDALTINDEAGFHPAAEGLANLLENDRLAIVHGVGYPEPNRSHFESMDIWHTCQRKQDPRKSGWLGRYLEHASAKAGGDLAALHLGGEKQPLALTSREVSVPSVQSLDRFRLQGNQTDLVREINAMKRENNSPASDLLSFVETNTQAALTASQRIEQARKDYKTSVSYPEDALAEKLKTVAQLIDAGLQTKVYYVALDGFDTHSQQAGAHESLLRRWSSALDAFVSDLNEHGHGDRAVVLSFSEFGRRVKENASEGTDHGAAAPMFLAGNPVKSGIVGKQPSLTDLHDGDLRHHTDFRQVYATVLEDWLGVDSESVVGGKFAKLPVV